MTLNIFLFGSCRLIEPIKKFSKLVDNITFHRSTLTLHSIRETVFLIDFINGLISQDNLFNNKNFKYFENSNYKKKTHYTNEYRESLRLKITNSDLIIIEQATLRYERKSERLLTQDYIKESIGYIYDIFKKPILIVSNINVISNITNKLLEKRIMLDGYLENIEKNNKITKKYPLYFLYPKIIFDYPNNVDHIKKYFIINKGIVDLHHYNEYGQEKIFKKYIEIINNIFN